jgi:hypothetical protein
MCVYVSTPLLLALCCVCSFELVLVNPHENIVSVYGICTDAPDGNLRLVMRLCVKSVWDLLQQHRPRVSHPLLGRCTFGALPCSFAPWGCLMAPSSLPLSLSSSLCSPLSSGWFD